MPNVFDQFDQKSENPFDQFDTDTGGNDAKQGNSGGGAPAAIPPASPIGKRLAEGFLDPIYGAAQIADKAINPIRQMISPGASSMEDVIRERDANYHAPEGVDWARMAGNVANPVSWAGGGVPGLTRAGAAAAHGALQAGLAPVSPDGNFAERKVEQAGAGAVAGRVLSKALAGLTPTAAAKELMDRGVQPTVGQSLGGIFNTTEQKLTSVPFVGDAITYARNRAQKEFERAALNEATGGPVMNFTGKTLDDANDHAKRLYESVVPYLRPTREAVQNVQQSLRDAMANPELIDQNKQVLMGLVTKYFSNLGQLVGPSIKVLDSELGNLARKYNAGDPQSKVLAHEIWKLQQGFREGLETGLTGEQAATLHQANATWRNLIPFNKAASARADERITPRALQKAMARQQGKDVTMANIDPLVDNAVAVLPSTIPDSGTAGRAMLGGGALVGGGTLGVLPQMLGAGAVAGLGATRPVQRAIMGNTAWQRTLGPMDGGLAAAIAAALRGQNNKENPNE